jgi:hypothetical protein
MQLLFYMVYYHSACFGRGSRPSSGVIYKTVMAATGVCYTCGVEWLYPLWYVYVESGYTVGRVSMWAV